MGNKINQNSIVILNEGWYYNSKIESYDFYEKYVTKNGVRKAVIIFFKTSEGETLDQFYIASTFENSRLGTLIKELVVDYDPNDFDLDELVGKECNIRVAHNQLKDGKIFANVIEVKKPVNENEMNTLFNNEENDELDESNFLEDE